MRSTLANTCLDLLPRLRTVHVDEGALATLAAELTAAPPSLPNWRHPAFPAAPGPALQATLWLGNALNFCYWVYPGERMWTVEVAGRAEVDVFALFGAISGALADGVDLLDGAVLASGVAADALFLRGRGHLPLHHERAAILREMGRVLLQRFDGRLEAVFDAAPRDAVALARFLAITFPAFDDSRRFLDRDLPFLKRAQLAAAMQHCRARALGEAGLDNSDQLTLFADYMLPRVLRARGVLVYDPPLAGWVDRGVLIPAGSVEESEIRVATVAVGELLCRSCGVHPIALDAWLWQAGQALHSPHHRTISLEY